MYLEEALTRFQDQYPIVLRNRNADIQAQNPHSHQVAYLLMAFGMMDLLHHTSRAGGSNTVKSGLKYNKADCCGQDATSSWGQISADLKWCD